MRRESWINLLVIAFAMAAFGALGGTQALGAHPFWSMQVAWIGIALGIPAAIIGSVWIRSLRLRIGVGVVLVLVSGVAAHSGKTRFAASFAEDFVAGGFWYFGWMAVCASLVFLAAQLLPLGQMVRRRH